MPAAASGSAPLARSGDLFDHLARRYDRGNRFVSLGQDLRWKRKAAAALPATGLLVDIGAGTGDLARLMAAGRPHARVLALDLSAPMLRAGAAATAARHVHMAVADAARPPLPPGSADGAATGFLLRNLPSIDAFLAAWAGVLRPGAPLAILEIAYPRGWRRVPFGLWFHGLAPVAAGLATGQWSAYRYLSRSLRGFPAPEELARKAEAAGLQVVRLKRSRWTGVFLLVLRR